MMKRNVYFFIAFIIVLIIIFLLLKCRQNNVFSYFDRNDEDWKVVGDVKNAYAKPDYHPADGNPGGYLSATDETTGGVWYWSAPKKFLGSKGKALGKQLTFDLKQSELINQFDDADVILESKDLVLVCVLPSHPQTSWTSFSVVFSADAGWKINNLTGEKAREEDLKKVLSRLTGLKIRGEYITGPDVGSIDNVCLYLK